MTGLLIFLAQIEREPFLPQTLEDVLAVLAQILGGALLAGGFVWRILDKKIKRISKSCSDEAVKLRTEHTAMMATLRAEFVKGLQDEAEDREALRHEVSRDLKDEVEDRKHADEQRDERVRDMAQNLHNDMGEMKILKDKIAEDRLQRAEEIHAIKLELQRGLNEMRDLVRRELQDGFKRQGRSE